MGRRAQFTTHCRAASPCAHRRLHGGARNRGAGDRPLARRHRLWHRRPHLGRGSARSAASKASSGSRTRLCAHAGRRSGDSRAVADGVGGIACGGFQIESAEVLAPLGVKQKDARVLLRMIERGINTPLTSSCGRLFDAVAAVVLGRGVVDYEAQAAIELEGLAVDEADELDSGYDFDWIAGDWKQARAHAHFQFSDVARAVRRFARGYRQAAYRRAFSRRRCLGICSRGGSGRVRATGIDAGGAFAEAACTTGDWRGCFAPHSKRKVSRFSSTCRSALAMAG